MSAQVLVSSRQADAGDAEIITALATHARRLARPQRGGELLLDHDRAGRDPADVVAEAFAAVDRQLWVGEIDAVVVGYASARLDEQGPVKVAFIEDLFVHVEARGIGVAAGLLDEVAAWARQAGASALESVALPGDRETKNFFERLGMKTRKMRVSTRLD